MDIVETGKIVEMIERLVKAYDIAITPRLGKQTNAYELNEMEKAINRLSFLVAQKEAN